MGVCMRVKEFSKMADFSDMAMENLKFLKPSISMKGTGRWINKWAKPKLYSHNKYSKEM